MNQGDRLPISDENFSKIQRKQALIVQRLGIWLVRRHQQDKEKGGFYCLGFPVSDPASIISLPYLYGNVLSCSKQNDVRSPTLNVSGIWSIRYLLPSFKKSPLDPNLPSSNSI